MRAPNFLTEENFKYYMVAISLGPLLFYAPKFFEIRTENIVKEYQKLVNCSEILGPEIGNLTLEEVKFL